MTKTGTLNGKSIMFAVREEDLEALEELLKDLYEKSDKHREDGRVFMMQVYIELIANIQIKVNRIQLRFKREELANLRREARDLKAEQRAKDATESGS